MGQQLEIEEEAGSAESRPFSERTEELFGDPRVSHWLKRSLAGALARDPVEAIRDTERLLALLNQRLTEAPFSDSR